MGGGAAAAAAAGERPEVLGAASCSPRDHKSVPRAGIQSKYIRSTDFSEFLGFLLALEGNKLVLYVHLLALFKLLLLLLVHRAQVLHLLF